MRLGEKLLNLRKKVGMSQEEVAEKLDVSRQTVSKWETDQTVPELVKVQMLCNLYEVDYEYLMGENKHEIKITDMDAFVDEIDWTSAWAKKYPILANYQKENEIEKYQKKISGLCEQIQKEYGFTQLDSFLVLKDMIYQQYRQTKKEKRN